MMQTHMSQKHCSESRIHQIQPSLKRQLWGLLVFGLVTGCSSPGSVYLNPSANLPNTSGSLANQPSPHVPDIENYGNSYSLSPQNPYGVGPQSEPGSVPSSEPVQSSHVELVPDQMGTAVPSALPVEKLALREGFFKNYGVNPFVETESDPLSTFAIDVDTASYTLARNYLRSGVTPPKEAVRVEEFVNAFDYGYAEPQNDKFSIVTELSPSVWGEGTSHLLRVGIQGQRLVPGARKPVVLTLVVDVSGSMNTGNRLGLVQSSLKLLVDQLQPSDQVGLVVYGNDARVVQPPVLLTHKTAFKALIDSLRTEGSTNVEAGLRKGYELASQHFQSHATNRVILCSDGVANVGATSPDSILAEIRQAAESQIFLTTLGFGMGNYNDTMMEQLANQGNGMYAYIDGLEEARRSFSINLDSQLQVLGQDGKIQIQFNPQVVGQYRLLGYENRHIADQDFRNDAVDAGEMGPGHSVTAVYEVRLKDTLAEIGQVFFRYKDSHDYHRVKELKQPILSTDIKTFEAASASFKLAVAVASYAEILRESPFSKDLPLDDLATLADQIKGRVSQPNQAQELSQLIALTQQSMQTTRRTVEVAQAAPPQQVSVQRWQSYLQQQFGGKF